ncbi:MAG: MMPL family transporter [Acidimicrobiia bacterium]|nr:MMPL family transporter [Acidimicrobiia bacterium]NNC75729.1 MMPL family transporter [Acidimicrobiia bacterium]
MKRIITWIEAAVRRSPVLVLVGALIVTLVLGAFVSQQEQASGNEGFSPDSPEFLAGQIIGDRFDTSAVAAVQVVFTAESGDVLTADGLKHYLAVQEAVLASDVGPVLIDGPQPAINGFFTPAILGFEESGLDPATATDEQVKAAYLAGLEALPPETQGQVTITLSSENTDMAAPSSTAGLMIVLIDSGKIPDDPDQVKLQAAEVDMQERIEAIPVTDTTAAPFSFALLFADSGEFAAEIGRLFGTAFLIIIVILGFVFWINPRGRLTWLTSLRRAGADVGLAMLVIVLSITWMNGIGVLLGPKYLGIIGNFSEILQIIPILLIGLGVDYAIHLNSRYREELADGQTVVGAAGRATRTVGVALVLATVTTAVGFLTNIVSPITAIKDFGILATVGISSAFVLMLTVVPSVRILLDRRAEAGDRLPVEAMGASSERLLPKLMGRMAILAEKIPVVMLVIALGLGGLGAYGLTQLSTEFSFTDFLPEGAPLLETFDVLVDEFGGGLGETTNVLIEGDVASPDVHNGIVQAWSNMADTEDVLAFGPRAAAESPVSVIAQMVTPPADGGSEALYNADFAQTAFSSGLQQDLTVAPGTDVAGLYEAASAINPEGMQRVAALGDDGTYRYINVAVSTQGGEAGALDLSDGLKADFESVSTLAGLTATPTNENIISKGVVLALQDSQVSSIAISLVAAMVLLVLNFLIEVRRPFLGVITIAPVILVVLWVFGLMALTGISFNPVTAMIAAIAIGIGVPYTIHVTHRYEEDRQRYDDESRAIRSTMTHTGGALAGSAFTTVAGFGILVTSSLTPFKQLGLVTAYAIGGALVAAVFVLPSMLVLWDRWHRARGHEVIEERNPLLTDGAPAS